MVVATMERSISTAQQALAYAVNRLGADLDAYTEDDIANALATAIITKRHVIPPDALERLWPIVGKYFA